MRFNKKWGVFFAMFFLSKEIFSFNIRLQQAPMVPILQQIALSQQANLLIDEELNDTLSLQLKNTDFHHFLKVVAKLKKLDLTYEDNIYFLVKDLDKINIADKKDLGEEIQTKSFKLQFAKASDVMKSLTSGNGSLLSSNGSITFDDRSNLLIVKDEPHQLKQISKLIPKLDQPVEQIAIEARIVTIADEHLQELGVRWGLFEPTSAAHKVMGSLDAAGRDAFNIANNLNVNFPTNTIPSASVALQVAKINGRLLDLELTALERENNVKIIASPKLLTTNKKSASIKQGTELPYVLVNERNGSQKVEFREAVLGLEVTPHISKDQNILLDLIVSQNSPGSRISYGLGEVVSIDKQEISTQVFAKDGETIVLGGVFQDTISKGKDKVPLLGDIPVVKHLFSKDSDRHQKRELVIFVTPHILKQGQTLHQFQQEREKIDQLYKQKSKSAG